MIVLDTTILVYLPDFPIRRCSV
jgi:hypothetical protein